MAEQQGHSYVELFLKSLKLSLGLFRKNDPLRMAGATAFFTTFALPPIVFILAQLFGMFIGRRSMGRGLLEGISNTVGEEGAGQVRQVLRSIRGFGDSWYVIAIGFLFLLFVATSLFAVIRNSLNQIWQIGVRSHPGILYQLGNRLVSLGVIALAGLLFLAELLLESLETIGGSYADTIWQGSGNYFKSVTSEVVGIFIIATWFTLLFRFLADGRPTWKAAITGGILTGFLFTGGKLLLQVLLINSNISQLYGASGSFVLVLLFVFYSSFILYFGACFISVWSGLKELPITPTTSAYYYRIRKMNPMHAVEQQHEEEKEKT